MRNRPNHTMELTVADVAFQFRWTARNPCYSLSAAAGLDGSVSLGLMLSALAEVLTARPESA